MNFQEQFETLMKNAQQEKDNEIKRLTEENRRLKEETEQLKQKAQELKKVLDDFLDHNQSRTIFPRHAYPVSIPVPNADVNKPSISTSDNKCRPGPGDEQLTNGGTNHHPNRINYSNQEDFGTSQGFRPESDTDIINQATQEEMSRQHYHAARNVHNNHSQNNLPTTLNSMIGNPQKRFNNYNNNLNGTNNNNRNRNNHNNHNHNSKYTIFISWPGVMTKEQLTKLFEDHHIEYLDIRYTSPKQFAHVDLKSEGALKLAMTLNGKVLDDKQGQLRVEQGKPRNNNPTENGQRPQNQNKNFNNRPNNKNSNGYNTNSSQKQNAKYTPNNYNHHNNNHSQYQSSFVPPEDKDNGINLSYFPENKQNVE